MGLRETLYCEHKHMSSADSLIKNLLSKILVADFSYLSHSFLTMFITQNKCLLCGAALKSKKKLVTYHPNVLTKNSVSSSMILLCPVSKLCGVFNSRVSSSGTNCQQRGVTRFLLFVSL